MSSTSDSEDEFEQFRARAFSGGNILSLQQLREEQQKHGRDISRRSLCPADEDSSDSDDDQERIFRSNDRNKGYKQHHSRNGTLKVPKSRSRSRSLSPNYASTIAARSRTRLKVEEMRQLLAKHSQDSQDEPPAPMVVPPVAGNRSISPKLQSKAMKKRSIDICFPQTYTDLQEENNITEGTTASCGGGPRHAYRRRSDADHLNPSSLKPVQSFFNHNGGTRHTYRRRSDADHLNSSSLKLVQSFSSHNGDRLWDLGEMRPRVSSMPSGSVTKRPSYRREKTPSFQSFGYESNKAAHLIREFQLTPKGNVISKGNFLSQSNTSMESAEGSTTASATSLVEGPYNVYMIGIPGVGIRAIINTFIAEQFEDLDSGGRCLYLFCFETSTLNYLWIFFYFA